MTVRRLSLALSTTISLALFACASDSSSGAPAPEDAGSASETGTPTKELYLPPGSTLVPFASEAPERKFSAATQTIDGTANDYLAVLETDAGRVVLDLLESDTPNTVNSFVFLALHHFYDGLAFHRVIDGFMAQSGDPNSLDADTSSWGTGGPGYTFGLEVKPELNFDGAGVLGMARSSKPDSNGSQFFITFAAAKSLDQKYTVFGKVTEGLDVLPSIVRGEPPKGATRIRTVHIVKKSK